MSPPAIRPARVNQPILPGTRSTGASAASFVDVTAKLALLMAVLGVAWCVFQLLLVTVLGGLDIAGWMRGEGLHVPEAMLWIGRHAASLSVLLLLLSLAFLAVSWALLKRREWGRVGFIVFLVVVALANFAVLPGVDVMFDALQGMLPEEFLATREGREAAMQIRASRLTAQITGGGTALVFAALHGWLVVRFQRPDVRALFH